jgi:phenylacetate-coenzyme A ligase PaaK-like adenylate-forming protein
MKDFSDLKKLPLLEKSDAVNMAEKMYSMESNLKYYKTFTGGSSGKALTVMLDQKSIYRERACVCHYLAKLGYDPLKTKTVAFWGHNKDADYYYSPLKNEIVISPFRLFKENRLESICIDIEKFGATFIMGYPSAIYLFAQMLEKSGRKMKIDHVVYYAENCSSEEKQYIEHVFECPVDSYYGHTERAVFAEIYDSGCVFNDYYGYTELIPTENDNEYKIVCTGFLSHKMPLIRYATDDVVYKDKSGALHLVGHKRSEVHLISKNGQNIFKGAMTLHIEELKKINRYQYVQNEIGKAELHIVCDSLMSDDEMKVLNDYITRRCEGLLDVEVKIVDKLQLTSRGKYNWAINNIGND